jgi:hypothetical protein
MLVPPPPPKTTKSETNGPYNGGQTPWPSPSPPPPDMGGGGALQPLAHSPKPLSWCQATVQERRVFNQDEQGPVPRAGGGGGAVEEDVPTRTTWNLISKFV